MTPEAFIEKWQKSELKERSAPQSHFNDLCTLMGEQTPTDADQSGEWFCFEKGARKTGGGDGWADVWKKGHFGWEYKGPGKDLNKAYAQLQRYAVALENPPLLIVSDTRVLRPALFQMLRSALLEVRQEDLSHAESGCSIS